MINNVFDGLVIDEVGGDNLIEICEGQKFINSKINIVGSGNHIKLDKCIHYSGLAFNIKGNNKKIEIGPSCKTIIGLRIVSIRGDFQVVKIGKDFGCGGLEIQMNDGNESLSIGDDCLFSWGIKIRTSDGHSIIDLNTNKVLNWHRPVFVGNHVWVGEDVKILKGSSVPSNSVIGSGSIVTKKFTNENTIIAGVPAEVVKENVNWDRRMPSEVE